MEEIKVRREATEQFNKEWFRWERKKLIHYFPVIHAGLV